MHADLETDLRALPDRLAGLTPPDGLAGAVRSRHRRRRRRLVVAASVTSVLAVLGGGTAALTTLPANPAGEVAAAAPSTAPRGPLPTDPRLLPWPGRGPLIQDADAVRGALEAAARTFQDQFYRNSAVDGPGHLLWIGPMTDKRAQRHGIDRMAIVQTYLTGEKAGIQYTVVEHSTAEGWQTGTGGPPVDREVAGLVAGSWTWFHELCPADEGSSFRPECRDTHQLVFVLGAPDVDSVRFRYGDDPPVSVPLDDGVAATTIRIDPKYNVDPAKMSPKILLTRDGVETTIKKRLGAMYAPAWRR